MLGLALLCTCILCRWKTQRKKELEETIMRMIQTHRKLMCINGGSYLSVIYLAFPKSHIFMWWFLSRASLILREHHSVSCNKLKIFNRGVGDALSTFIQLGCSCPPYSNVKKHPNTAMGRGCLCITSLNATPFFVRVIWLYSQYTITARDLVEGAVRQKFTILVPDSEGVTSKLDHAKCQKPIIGVLLILQ